MAPLCMPALFHPLANIPTECFGELGLQRNHQVAPVQKKTGSKVDEEHNNRTKNTGI